MKEKDSDSFQSVPLKNQFSFFKLVTNFFCEISFLNVFFICNAKFQKNLSQSTMGKALSNRH